LPITFSREGNACDRCGKLDTEVGKMTNYKKYGENLLLCANCIEKTDEEKTLKCPRCKKVVGTVGMTEYNTEPMCYECKEIVKKKYLTKEERKQFFKSSWKFWITISLAIIGLAIAFLQLSR